MIPPVALHLDLGDCILLAIWCLGLVWTWVDSERRLGRTLERVGFVLFALIPVAGPLLYVLERPAETVRQRRDRRRRTELLVHEHTTSHTQDGNLDVAPARHAPERRKSGDEKPSSPDRRRRTRFGTGSGHVPARV